MPIPIPIPLQTAQLLDHASTRKEGAEHPSEEAVAVAAAAGPSFESSAVFTCSPQCPHGCPIPYAVDGVRATVRRMRDGVRLSVLCHTVPDTALRIVRLPYEWRRDAVEQQRSSALFGVQSVGIG